jgi:hypothetical protein
MSGFSGNNEISGNNRKGVIFALVAFCGFCLILWGAVSSSFTLAVGFTLFFSGLGGVAYFAQNNEILEARDRREFLRGED